MSTGAGRQKGELRPDGEDIRWWAKGFKRELGSGKQPLKVRAGDRLPAT